MNNENKIIAPETSFVEYNAFLILYTTLNVIDKNTIILQSDS